MQHICGLFSCNSAPGVTVRIGPCREKGPLRRISRRHLLRSHGRPRTHAQATVPQGRQHEEEIICSHIRNPIQPRVPSQATATGRHLEWHPGRPRHGADVHRYARKISSTQSSDPKHHSVLSQATATHVCVHHWYKVRCPPSQNLVSPMRMEHAQLNL